MNLLLLISGYIVYNVVNNNINNISGINSDTAVHVYKIDHKENTCGKTNTNTNTNTNTIIINNATIGECLLDSSLASLALKFDKKLVVGNRNCCQSKGYGKFKSKRKINVGPFLKFSVDLYEKGTTIATFITNNNIAGAYDNIR